MRRAVFIVAASVVGAGVAAGEPASRSDWTGLYVGTHVGGAWAVNDWRSADGPFAPGGTLDSVFPSHFSSGGMLAGGQVGYNRQVGAFVFGIESEAAAADIDQPARCADALFTCTAKIDALGTITGRFGWAFENVLLYGKAGGAWAHETFELVPSQPKGLTTTNIFHGDQLRWGYAAGAGAEYAFGSGLSAKLEYTYLGLGRSSATITDQYGLVSNVSVGQQAHLVKLGLNYRLGEAAKPWTPLASGGTVPQHAARWSGLYVGVHAGGGWGMTDWNGASGALATASTFYFPGSGTADGLVAGGQVGFNYQLGRWVIGAEAEGAWSNLDGYAKCAATLATAGADGDALTCHTRIDALAMVSGRLGRTWGDVLIYGKVGGAFARERHDASQDGQGSHSGSDSRTGYVIGSGLEFALTPAWSAKFEYDYVDLGNKRVGMTDSNGNASTVEISQKLNLFKIGLNYRIGADPFAAAPAPSPTGIYKAPRFDASPALDWTADAGVRYWYSSGSMSQDLHDTTQPSRLVSRLVYGDMDGHAAESFMRFDHRSGLFAKGYFGIGSLVNGQLNDEDFYLPPKQTAYSNTISAMKDGTLRYGSLDVGYNVLDARAGRLGVFVGYHYVHEIGRGFGCRQIATDTVCDPTVPTGNLALTETETWRGVAVGLNARMDLAERWKLEVDAAYLPYVDRSSADNHWLIAHNNPGPEDGHGWGTQLEAVLTYAVTDRFSVGAGGRYWYFATNAAGAQFTGYSQPSPIKFASDRYGGFLQGSYKFGNDGRPSLTSTITPAPASWSGVYVGGHLGAGWGRSNWSDPFPAPIYGDRVTTGGALAGGQVGVNYQSGRFVLGAEARGSWAQIEGTMTCFAGLLPQSDAGANCGSRIDGLGIFTGRLGVAAGQGLFYATGGAAVARERFLLNTVAFGGQDSSTRVTKAGWTAGGGVEQALTSHWSVGVDYKYVDLGSTVVNFTVPAVYASVASESVNRHVHLVTMGVNYRFDLAESASR